MVEKVASVTDGVPSFCCEWQALLTPVTRITRPAGFGKTTALDAVQASLRENFPVVRVSFADIEAPDVPALEHAIAGRLATVFCEWQHLSECASVPVHVRRAIRSLSAGNFHHQDLSEALRLLCNAVHKAVGKDPVVLLDDYDVPYLEAWHGGYLREASFVIESFLTKTFKANRHLERGLVMGTLPVAFNGGCDDVWNADECSALDDRYAAYFKPRGVLAARSEPGEGRRKWLHRLLVIGGSGFRKDWETVFAGRPLVVEVEKHIRLSDLNRSRSHYWSALMHCGLLQVLQEEPQGVRLGFPSEAARRQCLTDVRLSTASP